MTRQRVLVTGASGFVGGAVVGHLARSSDMLPRAARRRLATEQVAGIEYAAAPDLSATADWRSALRDCTAVVHAAARVHVMRDRAADPLAEFRAANVAGTLALARQAAATGVKRFVFISSIKVNGEETPPGRPFTPDDPPAPRDPYAISKLEAEQGLRALAAETGLEVAIIRPVLVYGPGVRANFEAMLRWLHRGLPLPFGAVDNRRSLVALGNLTDLVVRCLAHPAAANKAFVVSDGEDLSTPELLRRAASALGCRARLLPVPPALLDVAARALGRGDLARRLCGTLQVDIRRTRELLGWSPPIGIDDALARTAAHFLAAEAR